MFPLLVTIYNLTASGITVNFMSIILVLHVFLYLYNKYLKHEMFGSKLRGMNGGNKHDEAAPLCDKVVFNKVDFLLFFWGGEVRNLFPISVHIYYLIAECLIHFPHPRLSKAWEEECASFSQEQHLLQLTLKLI